MSLECRFNGLKKLSFGCGRAGIILKFTKQHNMFGGEGGEGGGKQITTLQELVVMFLLFSKKYQKHVVVVVVLVCREHFNQGILTNFAVLKQISNKHTTSTIL